MHTDDVLPKVIERIEKEFGNNDCIIPTIDTYLEYLLDEIKSMYPKKTDLLEIKKVANTDCRYIQVNKEFLSANIRHVDFGASSIERLYVLKFENKIYIIGADCGGGYTNRFDKNQYFIDICLFYGTTSKKFMEIFKIENELIFDSTNNLRHKLRDVENINDLHLRIKKLYGVKDVIDENKIDSSELKEQDLLKFLKSLFTLNYGKSARFFKNNKIHLDSNKMFDKNDLFEFSKTYFKHKLSDYKTQEKQGFTPIYELIQENFKDDICITYEMINHSIFGESKHIKEFQLKGDLYQLIYKKCLFKVLDEYYLSDIDLNNISKVVKYEKLNWKNELETLSIKFYHLNENELISQDIEIKDISKKYQVLNDLKKVNESNLEDSSKSWFNVILQEEQAIIKMLIENSTNEYIETYKKYFNDLGYFVNIKIDKKDKSSNYNLIIEFIAN